MRVHHLTSVDGEIVFDIDPDVVDHSAGGTRLADDVTVDEVAVLARAMTYKFAVFESRLGGAKAGIRPRLLDGRDETMARFCDEIRPMVESRTFLTGADLGTVTADFVSLRHDPAPSIFDEVIDGAGFEEVVTGLGVVSAADAWLGGLEGRSVAIEGFGNVGGGVAREAVRRGARVVAVSTLRGAVASADGFDVDALFEARAVHGDDFVAHLDLEVHAPGELHELKVDVLVPGARPGVYDRNRSGLVQARVISPAANVPYTAAGLDVLRSGGIAALPDFVCNGGAVLAYQSPPGLTAREVLHRVDREIGDRVRDARMAKLDPFLHATTLADTFLSTWIPAEHRPDAPAFAAEPATVR